MAFFKSSKHLFFTMLIILATLPRLHAESGIYDRMGIITEHGLHGAVPEENIDLFTGNLTLRNLDIHLPGPNGFDLDIWRVYNSKVVADRLVATEFPLQQEPQSWVGFGWMMHMGRLHSFNSEQPVVEFPDGRWETAYRNVDGSGTFLTRNFLKLVMWDPQHGGFPALYFKNGTVWEFGIQKTIHYGSTSEDVRVVTKIVDSYGHDITIQYDTSTNRIISITDSMGRVVTFTCVANTYPARLSYISVKNATGSLVNYIYNVDSSFNGNTSYFRLSSFKPPVLNTVNYNYNSNKELTTVNTSYGGCMNYTYSDQEFNYYAGLHSIYQSSFSENDPLFSLFR